MLATNAIVPADIGVIGVLILLEGLLSADNALVIALLVKHLPARERRNALLVGLVGSFVMRLGAILLATNLIDLWYLQFLGALYLLYLPGKHFLTKRAGKTAASSLVPKKQLGFWQTVVVVEFTDLVFAVDSILVAVTLSQKTVIVWIGGISGVVLLRFAAFILVRVLEVMPGLEHMAYVLVAWVGVKLAFMSAHSYELSTGRLLPVGAMNPWVFWIGMGVILVVGTFLAKHGPSKELADAEEILTESDRQEERK